MKYIFGIVLTGAIKVVREVELSWVGGMVVSIHTQVQISSNACSLSQYL